MKWFHIPVVMLVAFVLSEIWIRTVLDFQGPETLIHQAALTLAVIAGLVTTSLVALRSLNMLSSIAITTVVTALFLFYAVAVFHAPLRHFILDWRQAQSSVFKIEVNDGPWSSSRPTNATKP